MKLFLKSLAIFALVFAFLGCDSKESKQTSEAMPTQKKVKVSTTEISQAILEPALPLLKEQGFDVELVIVSGNVNVIRATNDGSTDAASGVHIKFMENFNKQNGGDLVMIKPYPYTTGIGLYSDKYKTIEELPVGAKISIMSDAMNMHRGLMILKNAGLIELDESKKDGYTLLDITKNPKNLQIIDMDQAGTVRSLQDVDAAIVFFTHMRNANRDFRAYIVRDDDAKEFPMGIVVKAKNENEAFAKALADALRSQPVRDNIAKKFDGVFEYLD
ncbi:MAG: MetQ/NlpA family ABC transporter substrate-binding protein [Campylobacteraceae bacterium]